MAAPGLEDRKTTVILEHLVVPQSKVFEIKGKREPYQRLQASMVKELHVGDNLSQFIDNTIDL